MNQFQEVCVKVGRVGRKYRGSIVLTGGRCYVVFVIKDDNSSNPLLGQYRISLSRYMRYYDSHLALLNSRDIVEYYRPLDNAKGRAHGN